MYGHNVRPGQQFGSQKLKFTGHLSDDRLLFAGLPKGTEPNIRKLFPAIGSHFPVCEIVLCGIF